MATNAVPMFMGSVWLCARHSVETRGSDDKPAEIRRDAYVRISDLGVFGVVKRITRAGRFVVEYWQDGGTHLAFRTRDGIVPV